MKITLLEFARRFVDGRLSANEFANAYIELWKIERDNNILQKYPDNVDECLSSIFCVADLYNPDSDREKYELDEDGLRIEVSRLLNQCGAYKS